MDITNRREFISTERHSKATADLFEERFVIGMDVSRTTLKVIYQRGTRSEVLPLPRRYKEDRHWSVNRMYGKFAIDTMFDDVKYI